MISYARQTISRLDLAAVAAALRSDFLTQGPRVAAFEAAVARYCGAKYAVAVSSGTAALHLACLALGLRPGDAHWTSSVTFVASANAGVYCGSRPGFVDISAADGNLDAGTLARRLAGTARGKRPRVIIPVHLAGRPGDLPAIRTVARRHGCRVIEDAAHALGARYRHRGRWYRVGACAHSDAAVFSFHAVKNMTTGEGGMIVTNDRRLHERLLRLRTHGITRDPRQLARRRAPAWYYEMRELGFNYRITDFQCALGLSQLRQLDGFIACRRALVARYAAAFAGLPQVELLAGDDGERRSAHHLCIVLAARRDALYRHLQARGIAANLHYNPVYRQPYYRRQWPARPADFPQAEQYYRRALSLPLYPGLTRAQQETVINAVREFYGH